MSVAMMSIREVRVVMGQRFMAMPVTAIRAGWHRLVVLVLVVRIVDMFMVVLQRIVRVFMAVLFGEVQPDTQRHQRSSNQQTRADRFA